MKKRVDSVRVRMLRNRYARTAESREFAEELVGEDDLKVAECLQARLREKGSTQTLHPRVAAHLMKIGAAEPALKGTAEPMVTEATKDAASGDSKVKGGAKK